MSPANNTTGRRVILASRSPRRLELLSLLIDRSLIEVRPSEQPEPGFEGLHTPGEVAARLRKTARGKLDDVRRQPSARDDQKPLVIAADTVVVVAQSGSIDGPLLTARETDASQRLLVLGQPPPDDWQPVVRNWFQRFYCGRTHAVATAMCIADGPVVVEFLVESRVAIRADAADLLDWYLATEEPLGKAGGYAIQGLGSVMVDCIDGSLSNVVGLPLEVLRDLIAPAPRPSSRRSP